MLDINAVKRVIKKRKMRGATTAQLIMYLNQLKKGAWKNVPEYINELIKEVEND
jgi:hypothetical protein